MMISNIKQALLFSIISFSALAQNDNPLYWKNRKPFEGYWQQDVHYTIQARLDDKTDIIDGKEELEYTNNSPDELNFVFFRLTQNAFQPGSYLDNLQKNNNNDPHYGRYESKGLGTVVESVLANGQNLKTELDNTILKVFLNQPIKPGQTIRFSLNFKTYFDKGSVRRRMKIFYTSGYKHYDGVHWYPRISVYDRKFGWTTDQHLGREFYGDYGTFDVELSLPNQYILDATGEMLNEKEMLPDTLRQKLDIKNFARKPLYQAPSEMIKPNGTYKTWRFHAENVHDFAFTADPTYRIGETRYNGVRCIALVREPHASRWQNAPEYTAKIIRTYSEDIGPYAYPKMIVADAEDGMEYPMLTLDAGLDPTNRSLLAHEIGHNWFFGMVGNNETYRAALDEGFTQFLTAWCMEKLEGKTEQEIQDSSMWGWYINRYSKQSPIREKRCYLGYMNDAVQDMDMPINTHSDQFNGALEHGGGYRHVYYKTATMLYNLQYVLGDELFLSAMQHYFKQWKFCHPYFEDFRNSIIQFTHVDLNWFFDQWMETTKHIDYKISCIHKGKEADEYVIKFKRKGEMQMPLDFRVTANDQKTYDFHIPNDWFVKSTPATVLPRWIGWQKVKPVYEAHVKIPTGIDQVEIDTTHRMADINMLNNSKEWPVSLTFDSRMYNYPDRTKYEVKARPDIWYNYFDGVKAGVHVEGGYMNYKHVFSSTVWLNTGFRQAYIPSFINKNWHDDVSGILTYSTGIERFSRNTYILLGGASLDGLHSYYGGFSKSNITGMNTVKVIFKSMYRKDLADLVYLLYPGEWTSGLNNNTINVSLEHKYNFTGGNGILELGLRSSSLGSDYSFSDLKFSAENQKRAGKFDLRTRLYAQYGTGLFRPKESSLFLASANPEELMDNKFTRSRGFIDNTALEYGATTNHFQMGGGLNLRGYAGYLVAQENSNGDISYIYRGSSGMSVSAELGFDRLFKVRPKFTRKWLKMDTYLFADAGVINRNNINLNEKLAFSDVRADAGLGTAFTIKKFGPLEMVKPFTIRADFPLFLNRPPAAEPDYFKFRWLIGINRSF